jgi:polyhydroxyalkanoate synthesis regulator protein
MEYIFPNHQINPQINPVIEHNENQINNNINLIQNLEPDLIPLADYPIVEINEQFITAEQILNELENWIEGNKIRIYLTAMINIELLTLDLDAEIDVHPDHVQNIQNEFVNAEQLNFTDDQNAYIEKVSKFIEDCNIDEMKDFIIYMSIRF